MTRLPAEHVPGGLWAGARVIRERPFNNGTERGVATGTPCLAWDGGSIWEPSPDAPVAIDLTDAPTLTTLIQRLAAHVGLPCDPFDPWGFFVEGPATVSIRRWRGREATSPVHGWRLAHPAITEALDALDAPTERDDLLAALTTACRLVVAGEVR